MKRLEKIKTAILNIVNKITWHVFPDKPKIMSILEFFVYLLIFFIAFAVYKSWNIIPEREIFIETEDLSTVKSHRASVNLSFNFSNVFGRSRFDSIEHCSALLTSHFYKCADTTDSRKLRRKLTKAVYSNTQQRFTELMTSQGCNVNSEHLFYQGISCDAKIKSRQKKELVHIPGLGYTWGELSCIDRPSGKHFQYLSEIISGDDPFSGCTPAIGIQSPRKRLGRPRWWWGYDISQSYFNIYFHSETIPPRKLLLEIDFIGATDFSSMYPMPDQVGMSNIVFTDPDKIDMIISNGIKFHATFPEMQNKQTIRVFALTGVLGFVLTIFFSFMINVVGYWIKKKKS